MPTLQVIGHEQDPGQKMLMDAGNDIADSIHKTQALKLTGQYYKILAQNADTDIKKFELDRKAKTMDMLIKVAETQDPNTKAMLIKALVAGPYGGDHATAFHDIADTQQDVMQQYMNMKQDPGTMNEQQLRGAQGANQQSEASLRQAQINAINRATGTNQDGSQAAPTAPGAGGGSTPNAGGFMLGDMNIGGMNFINPAADQAKAGAVATGTDLAKRNIAHQQFTRDFEDFKALNQEIPRTKDGIVSRAVRGAQTALAGWDQGSTEGALIASYNAASKRLTTTLARQVDVGNLSQTEQDAASKMVPSKYDSAKTNEIKMAFMEDMNRAIGSNEPSLLKGIIDKYKSKVQNATRADSVGAGNNQNASSDALDNLFKGLK